MLSKIGLYIWVIIPAVVLLSDCNFFNSEEGAITSVAAAEIGTKTDNEDAIDSAKYASLIIRYMDSIDRQVRNLTAKKYDLTGGSAEGGELNVYRSQAGTVKFEVLYFGETGNKEYSVYFKKRHLVAAIEKTTIYKMPIGIQKTQIDSVANYSYMFKDKNVIASINTQGVLQKGKNLKKFTEFNDLLKELTGQIDKKR